MQVLSNIIAVVINIHSFVMKLFGCNLNFYKMVVIDKILQSMFVLNMYMKLYFKWINAVSLYRFIFKYDERQAQKSFWYMINLKMESQTQ